MSKPMTPRQKERHDRNLSIVKEYTEGRKTISPTVLVERIKKKYGFSDKAVVYSIIKKTEKLISKGEE